VDLKAAQEEISKREAPLDGGGGGGPTPRKKKTHDIKPQLEVKIR